MAKDIMKIEFGLVYYGLYGQICIFLQTHHQHNGKGITIGTCQKWSLLQKALLTTRQIMYGNQSPIRNIKSGNLPSASQIYCCCLCLRYSVHIRMGFSTVYYPPMCHNYCVVTSFAKQSLVILNGLFLTDRRCQQSNNEAAPRAWWCYCISVFTTVGAVSLLALYSHGSIKHSKCWRLVGINRLQHRQQ